MARDKEITPAVQHKLHILLKGGIRIFPDPKGAVSLVYNRLGVLSVERTSSAKNKIKVIECPFRLLQVFMVLRRLIRIHSNLPLPS